MSENINLLLKKNAKKNKQGSLLLLCKRLAIGSLVVTVGCSVIFFILTFSSALSPIKQQENTVLTNLSFSQNKIAKYLFLKDRLTSIGNLLQTRYPMDTVLDTIQQQIPADVSIDSLNMTPKTMSLRLSSQSLLSLNTVAVNMSALLKNKQIFKGITIEGVILDAHDHTYTLALEGNFL